MLSFIPSFSSPGAVAYYVRFGKFFGKFLIGLGRNKTGSIKLKTIAARKFGSKVS